MEKAHFSPDPASIQQAFLATGDSLTALAERTAQLDFMVTESAGRLLFPAAPSGLAVLAVGGYGRRHLFPYSDVDLLLLFESERLALASREAIQTFLQTLWDARMRVSHSVRTPGECTEVHNDNIELNVSLLDQRYLAGDRALYAKLADKLPRFITGNRDSLIRNLSRTPRQIRQHVLPPGTERQGNAGQPARLPASVVARADARYRTHAVGRGRTRPGAHTGLSFSGEDALLPALPVGPGQ